MHDSYLQYFLDRIDRSVFVFTQVEMPDFFNRALKRHYVVYDLLASKRLELTCGGAKPGEIVAADRKHRRFAELADRILVNGPKLQALNEALLAPRKDVTLLNPFCPIMPDRGPAGARDRIMFFSAGQRWTNNRPFLDAMADVLAARPDLEAYFMTALKPHEDPESIAISRMQQLPNVRRITALSYTAHLAVLGRCMAVLDWSSVNDERLYSTSTRLIQAVSGGAAVFGNAETALDAYWRGYPGATSAAEPDAETLSGFIDKAAAGGFARDLKRAAEWNRTALADTRIFGGIQ